MNIRVHVSQPDTYSQNSSKRVWLLPRSIRKKCALLLGGDEKNPGSIPMRQGYLTQSQITVPIVELLTSLGREYIEVPTGKEIHYKRALIRGYEYIFEEIGEAWMFDSLTDILLGGYTHEKVDTRIGTISSISHMRKVEERRSDGGIRYLIKYSNEKKKWNDIYNFLSFEQDPETALQQCQSWDELAACIF